MASAPRFRLTYFNIQGAAEKVRLAFVLAGVEFEDNRIDHAQWDDLKPTTKFGQLPMMSIDGEEVAQSDAMLRYVGRLGNGLVPTDPLAELHMNEILGLCADVDRAFAPCLYFAIRPVAYGMDADYNKTDQGKEHIRKLRVGFVTEQLPVYLSHYERILSTSGGPFFGGASPSIADCTILPQLNKFRAGFIDHVPVTALDTHPRIIQYINDMMALPPIAEWYAKK